MWQKRLTALVILVIGAGICWYVYSSQAGATRPFKLGLDLSGGTQLVYRADLSAITTNDVASSMASLRETIERRVNLFGLSKPSMQVHLPALPKNVSLSSYRGLRTHKRQ